MSWRSAEPPISPPEADLYECRDCEGRGEVVHHNGPLGPLVAVVEWCEACDGRGEREYREEENPYAPDNWKEAEGIA